MKMKCWNGTKKTKARYAKDGVESEKEESLNQVTTFEQIEK